MNLADAFLQAIRENPGDDTPRLICADWLEDHDQPERAELIRVQVRLAQPKVPAEERASLRQREQTLLARHELEWTAPLQHIVTRARFVRGFVERVTLVTSDVINHGAELLALAPVRHLILTESRGLLSPLANTPALASIETLDFRVLRDPSLFALAGSPYLARLTGLILRFARRVSVHAANDLTHSPVMRQLQTLDLYATGLVPGILWVLLAEARCQQLRTLVLSGNGELADQSVNVLTASGNRFPALRQLFLGATGLTSIGAMTLAESPVLVGALRTLDLKNNNIGDTGARALAESPHLQSLTFLDLTGNEFDDRTGALLRKRFGASVRL